MDKYHLIIEFTGFKHIRLELVPLDRPDVPEEVGVRPERRTVDFSFDSNLDTMLIDSLDILLKKNRIDSLSLHTVEVKGDVDPNSSAYKVAIACAEALKSL